MFERFADALHDFFTITENDLRAGNGWAGDDDFALPAREHRPALTSAMPPVGAEHLAS